MTLNDNELLRQYVRDRSEPAFAELVRRHIQLVYSAVLRQVGYDRATAEDIAQAVFTDLARKAPRLLRHSSLTGWLYTGARFQAAKHRRSAQRRAFREHAAHAMNNILSEDAPQCDWEAVRPLLDDAMAELSREDREMVLWRYFEKRPYLEIGLRLGLKENTARMRLERALEKLRAGLAKRGITSSSLALAAALAAHAMEEVPSSLTERVCRASSAAGAGFGLAWLLVSAKARLVAGALGLVAITAIVLSAQRGVRASHATSAQPESPVLSASPMAAADTSGGSVQTAPANSSLDPAEESELRLLLVVAETSRPIAQGEVLCTFETDSDSDIREFRSGNNGQIRIPVAKRIVGLQIVTRIEGFADTRLAWRRDRSEIIPHEYSLRLTAAVTLGGSVVDANNAPLGGAEVGVSAEESTTSARPECHVASFNIKTDVAGRWRSRRVAPELISGLMITARHPDFATVARLQVSAEADAEERLLSGLYSLRLDPVTTIAGTVLDPESNPISGATIRAGGLYDLGRRTTRSGSDGTFSLAGCALGSVTLTGSAEGFAPTTVRVESSTDAPPVRLILDRGKALSVRILDANGNPVANASVDVEPNLDTHQNGEPQRMQTFRQDRTTDTNGVAFFSSLPDYDLWVGVSTHGFIRQDGITAHPGGAELVVNLVSNLVVSGTVRDAATGEPIPKFRVRAGKPDSQGPHFSDLDRFVLNFAAGKFRHTFGESVAIGDNKGYLLRFEANGYEPSVSRLIAPDEGYAELEINLHPASTRSLTIFNPDGTAAAWADVGLLDLAKGNCLALTPGGFEHYNYQRTDGALQQTDADGSIQLSSTDTVHWLAIANRAGFLETNVDGLADGAHIILQPWAQIEGALPERPDNRAHHEVWIQLVEPRLNALMAGLSFHVGADEAGHFVLSRVPPGRMWVMFGSKKAISDTSWTYTGGSSKEVKVHAGEKVQLSFDNQGDVTGK